MKIAFANGNVYLGRAWSRDAVVTVEQGRIAAVAAGHAPDEADEVIDLAGGWLLPGFIDVQVNGGGGVLLNDAPTPEGIAAIAAAHARFGTTAMLPTLISATPDVIARGLDATDEAIAAGVPGCIGIHVEGPVLNAKRRGIHSEGNLRKLDEAMVDLLIRPRAGRVLFTIAPEYLHADQARALIAAGVVLAMGHSDADYETARAAFGMGVTGVTHLFNAMSALHHRNPGMVGAALENRSAWCGLIADGYHVHPAVMRIALASRPLDRFVLVTDAMPCVGSDRERFTLDGREITVADGRCVGADGTLAGASLDMAGAVRNAVDMAGLSVAQAVDMATVQPAEFLGIAGERGTIAAGRTADFVQLDRAMAPQATWIAGERVF
ncbi:N-acetylglucosamine 6-phosphate deacetylase [Novosphingobium sp. PhB57]|jgi:N-acetylglucosamine-6-phosphate deacetylase|uniref:N-acetylglucosamine-6-phosphate deacetylase n=1 Tax=Novosphingobium sp. PhB57 TaxID=2485107 RepID=UPI0010509317|nr:N-acetylglucosamine-6-phosphate deacetylase [Novosphingobium sp. PhB57]TCU57203.1 N-acetylglucosamine 6-phosphate deacetylase [Novosphingobium sp. PhB57]